MDKSTYLVIGSIEEDSFLGQAGSEEIIGLKFRSAIKFKDEKRAKEILEKMKVYRSKNAEYTPEIVEKYKVYRINLEFEEIKT